ncbi:MAG: lamin tail domain-containing protein [Weeksellaceae bacterium]
MRSFSLKLLFIILFFFTTHPIFAIETTNNSFESADMTSWRANSTNVTVLRDNVAYDGLYSAKITNTSSSSYGVEQILTDVIPEQAYEITSYVQTTTPTPSKVFIRIAWYSSTDGTGSQLSTTDSEIVTEVTNWRRLQILTEAPATAHSAKLRLLVASGTAWFDLIEIDEYIAPTDEPEPSLTPTPTVSAPTPTLTSLSYDNVYISEVLVYPETNGKEWVELYNNNLYSVNLTNWSIDDAVSGGVAKKLTHTIPAQSYAVIELSTSLFNNTGDSVRLLDAQNKLKDEFKYTESEKNTSWGRTSWISNTFCLQEQSKSKPNLTCVNKTKDTSAVLGIRESTRSAALKQQNTIINDSIAIPYAKYEYKTSSSTPIHESSLASPFPHNQPDSESLPLGITLSGSYAVLSFASFLAKITFALSKSAVQ